MQKINEIIEKIIQSEKLFNCKNDSIKQQNI